MSAKLWFGGEVGVSYCNFLGGLKTPNNCNNKPVNGLEFTSLEQIAIGEPEKRDLTYLMFLVKEEKVVGRKGSLLNPRLVQLWAEPAELPARQQLPPEVEATGDTTFRWI